MSWRTAALYAAMAAVAMTVAIAYVAAEDAIYFWDYGAYFERFKHFGERFASGDTTFVRDIIKGIRHDEYNASTLVPLLPLHGLLGGSRAVYIAALAGLYLIPAILLAVMLTGLTRDGRASAPNHAPLWIVVAALLYWPLWSPVLRGFPDIAGLVPLGAATFLLLQPERLKSRPLLYGILIGALIWCTFALRRWYAFSCLSLLTVAGANALWRIAVEKTNRKEELSRAALLFGSCGVTTCALLMLQWPIVWQILTTFHASAYEGYQEPRAELFARVFLGGAGPFLIALTAVGVGRALVTREWRTLYLSACTACSFMLFTRVQVPSYHHMMPWFFWMFPAFIGGISWIADLARTPVVRWLGTAVMGLTFAAVYIPGGRASLTAVDALWPRERVFPLKTENLAAYRALTNDLLRQLGADDRFAVFAASMELADDALVALEPALAPRIAWAGEVDQRDGLIKASLEARIAVVTNPVALTLRSESQRVVSEPDHQILAGTGFGAAYRQAAGPYRLAGGLDAYIYERTRPLGEEDWRDIRNHFLALYPEWQETPNGVGLVH